MTSSVPMTYKTQPPSGGCVLKRYFREVALSVEGPAAFGRLCVETITIRKPSKNIFTSRLRAAVC